MKETYKTVRPGHLHQIKRTGPGPTYSTEYMNYYDRIPSNRMSVIRYSLLHRYIGHVETVCDFGYGNGAFLSHCAKNGIISYGYDVSDYPTPTGTHRLNNVEQIDVDVVTFFDSIEHIENENLHDFLGKLKTKNVIISAPWFHEFMGPEWFDTWKHRKPNEHFHHFDMHGIVGLLKDSGYKLIHVGNEEDEIRKPIDHLPNILTVVAKKL